MKKMFYGMIKHITVGILVLAMILGTLPVTSYAAKDEPSTWAKEFVESAIKKGYVPKQLRSQYKKPIKKVEMAQLFAAYLEYVSGDKIEDIIRKSRLSTAQKGMYSDISDRGVELMGALRVFYADSDPRFDTFDQLYEKGVFAGGETVNKGLGAYYFSEFLKVLGVNDTGYLNADETNLAQFDDLDKSVNNASIAIMFNHGLMGASGKKLNLSAELTREQVISILEKIDRSEFRKCYYSYFNGHSPRSGYFYPYELDSFAKALPFPYMGKGAAYLFSIGRRNDGWHREMTLKLPGQKQDITLDNRDIYKTSSGEDRWGFEVGLELADALADEKGNIHVAFVLRTAHPREELRQDSVPMMIIRSYAPSGKVLTTRTVYAKNISGLKNLGRFANQGSFEMEYKDGKYEVFAIAENVGRTERRPVVMTVSGNNATAKYLLKNPKALVRQQDMLYSEALGGYVYAILANDGEQRGFNLLMPDGKEYNIFHIWQKPNFKLKDSLDFYKDLYAELGGIIETSKSLMLVGTANREIAPGALTESKDVFVQVMSKENPTLFLGGEERTGKTNIPVEKHVTDKGVIWLTKLEKNQVAINPKLVKVGENAVILWTVAPFAEEHGELKLTCEKCESPYFAIIGPDGSVLKPATALPKYIVLGKTHMPVEHKGGLYWTTGGFNGVRFVDFKPEIKGKK